jgi:hypothetical protein
MVSLTNGVYLVYDLASHVYPFNCLYKPASIENKRERSKIIQF